MCAGTVIAATGKEDQPAFGAGKKLPVTAGCFLIASMAIAGFPLLNGFVSKSLIMNAAAESGFLLGGTAAHDSKRGNADVGYS